MKLEPCPCCGAGALVHQVPHDPFTENSGGYYIECSGCRLTTPLMFAVKDDPLPSLRDVWNRRTPRPEVAGSDDAALWELRKVVLAYTAWAANPHSGARATELSVNIGSAKKLLEDRERLHLHPTAADSFVRSPLAMSRKEEQ